MNLSPSRLIRHGLAIAVVAGVALVASDTHAAHAATVIPCHVTCLVLPTPPSISVTPARGQYWIGYAVTGQSFTPGGTVDVYYCLDPITTINPINGTLGLGCGPTLGPPNDVVTTAGTGQIYCDQWWDCVFSPAGVINETYSYPCGASVDLVVWAQDRQTGLQSNQVTVPPAC
jgi:hypothetical protein